MARIKAFEEFAEEYEEWFEKNRWAYESELAAVRRLLPDFTHAVEIGLGTGRFAIPLGITNGNEPSPRMAEIARAKGLNVVEQPCEDLPFDDEQFDLALMVTTICFVDDVSKCLSEIYRVLQPGGYIIVGFIDSESPLGRLYQAKKDKTKFYGDATFYSYQYVSRHLKAGGFMDLELVQTIFQQPSEMNSPDEVKDGSGEGSFIVIRGKKGR
jgi:SAM-dependent methyltransferase